jgi:hypothetical protein
MTREEVRTKERLKQLDKKYKLDEPLTPQTMNGALADGPMAPPGGNKPNGAQAAAGSPDDQPPAPDPTAKKGKKANRMAADFEVRTGDPDDMLHELTPAQLTEFLGEGILPPDLEEAAKAYQAKSTTLADRMDDFEWHKVDP